MSGVTIAKCTSIIDYLDWPAIDEVWCYVAAAGHRGLLTVPGEPDCTPNSRDIFGLHGSIVSATAEEIVFTFGWDEHNYTDGGGIDQAYWSAGISIYFNFASDVPTPPTGARWVMEISVTGNYDDYMFDDYIDGERYVQDDKPLYVVRDDKELNAVRPIYSGIWCDPGNIEYPAASTTPLAVADLDFTTRLPTRVPVLYPDSGWRCAYTRGNGALLKKYGIPDTDRARKHKPHGACDILVSYRLGYAGVIEASAAQCPHPIDSISLARVETRINCKGKQFEKKVYYCEQCGAEFSL